MLAFVLAGCGPATYNVRASRAFANEEPDPVIVESREEELERALALGDELLLGTPYSPGDGFPARLRLDDERGDSIKDRIAASPPYETGYEVPIVQVYRVHLEGVLREARAMQRQAPPRFPCLLAAGESLAPGVTLREPFAELVRARRTLADLSPEKLRRNESARKLLAAREALAAAAKKLGSVAQGDPAKVTIARDVLSAVSYVLRMDIEAAAVAPHVIKQGRRLARDDRRKEITVGRARAALSLAEEEKDALEPLAEALAARARMPLKEAAGFVMHEGFFSQALAVNMGAIHMLLRGGAEVFFYNRLAARTGIDEDTGVDYRLTYSVKPVLMAGGRAIIVYDFLNRHNAARLNIGFLTDRLFSANGNIDNQNSIGSLLGLSGMASDLFDIGADLLGLRGSIKLATFDTGRIIEVGVDRATGRDTGPIRSAPFQLTYRQIDVGFDASLLWPEFFEDLSIEDFLVGYRFMDFRLPRALYRIREKETVMEKSQVFDRESIPAGVESKLYMGGFSLRYGRGEWPRIAPYGDLGLYVGAGPVDDRLSAAPARSATLLALDGSLGLGLRVRITPRQSRFRLLGDVSYGGEVIAQAVISRPDESQAKSGKAAATETKPYLGGVDLFHGPRLRMVLIY
jgi:hypothetical protein